MLLRTLAFFAALAAAPLAHAQTLFADPLSDAQTYRAARGDLSIATQRLRYEATRTSRGVDTRREISIDLAPDWALVRLSGESASLYDFRLNRVFTIGADGFTTQNGLSLLSFRVFERQNRHVLQRALTEALEQPANQLPGNCDADSELGISLPSAPTRTEFRERDGTTVFRCDDSDMGSYTLSSHTPSAAFWPTLYAVLPMHVAMLRRVRGSERAPQTLVVSFNGGTNNRETIGWRLIGAEAVSTPYPLDGAPPNRTAETLDDIVAPGAGQIARDAIAGRFEGGAPTLQAWDQRLGEIARREGDAAASMLLSPSFNMFPEIDCGNGASPNLCRLTQGLRVLSDPAPWAVIEIGMAEGQRNIPLTIAAMERAQSSPYRDHPVLGAAFALAVTRFNDAQSQQARAANLPMDVQAMQARAIAAYPHNPAYWTDLADTYIGSYDWFKAFTLIDVAFSLPMPSAIERNSALAGKRDLIARLRRDFPDATLQQ